VAAFRKAIDLRPDVAHIYHHLSIALMQQKKLAEAEPACRKVIQLQPHHAQAHCYLGLILRGRGKFEESLAALRRGHELGLKRPPWRFPSAMWIRQTERLVKLDARLPAILAGEAKPASVIEQFELGQLCMATTRYTAAARFFRDAFAAEARLAERVTSGNRQYAACAAVLAACRQGKDAAKLDDREVEQWRQQALDWLRADLAWWSKTAETAGTPERAVIARTMRHWQSDPELAGVRDRAALARLPQPQREQWQNLWADVRALLARASAP
jgi:tetratricopeptide (TPR) repeat protein